MGTWGHPSGLERPNLKRRGTTFTEPRTPPRGQEPRYRCPEGPSHHTSAGPKIWAGRAQRSPPTSQKNGSTQPGRSKIGTWFSCGKHGHLQRDCREMECSFGHVCGRENCA
uniref:CCHC-type domain-containing protein n=1 Tax=Chelonoidis abingdonii TaxID=106734 RepID=A0A8C0H2F1_CHEAB